MWNYKLDLLSLWSLILAIWMFTGLCGSQEEDTSCEYSYLLQPPSELSCNPYLIQLDGTTEVYTYSINLKCVVVQFEAKDEPELRWVQVLADAAPQTIVADAQGTYWPTTDISIFERLLLFNSVLAITNMAPPNSSHTYWCEFCKNKETSKNTCNMSLNRLTIYEPEVYAMYPLCSEDTTFAERVCESIRPSTDNAPCSNTGNCGDTGTACNSTVTETSSLNTAVIVGAVTGAVVLVLLVVVIIELVVCCIFIRRKRRRNGKQEGNQNTERFSPVIPAKNLQQERNHTPLTATSTSHPENQTITVMSDRQQEPPIPRPVGPQSPNVLPPTHVGTPKMPLSAQKRAASLLRQLQRPRKSVDKRNVNGADSTGSDKSTNEQGSTPRKKPYKSLEMKTVDGPNLYMTTAKSPMGENRRKRPPPMRKPRQNQRTVSREKLLLSETTSSGYIVPADMNEVQQMYMEIEPGTQDYLGLYTVPHHRRSSSSSEEQPIYEEPKVD